MRKYFKNLLEKVTLAPVLLAQGLRVVTESPGTEGHWGKGCWGKRGTEGQASTVLGHLLSLGTWPHEWSPSWKLTGSSCCRRKPPGEEGNQFQGQEDPLS